MGAVVGVIVGIILIGNAIFIFKNKKRLRTKESTLSRFLSALIFGPYEYLAVVSMLLGLYLLIGGLIQFFSS